ncbi:MAG: hypothetical protein AAF805_02835 [Planctomycetota bacterium]
MLAPNATAAEVAAAINNHSARIQTYQAPDASISLAESVGLPLVQANIAVERPMRFRMRGVTALTGPEIDLGSNEERFWVWARRNEPPTVFTARHDAWASSPARASLPIEPLLVVEALGLTTVDPAAIATGPVPRGDGSLELSVSRPDGGRRVLLVDPSTAQVREQHAYGVTGDLVASVYADRFRYDPTIGASTPGRVRIVAPTADLDLTINTGAVVLNGPIAGGAQLWSVPTIPGSPHVDLTGPASLAGRSWAETGPTPVDPTYASASRAAVPAPPNPNPTGGSALRTLQQAPSTHPGFVGLPAGGRALPKQGWR